jgi:hypothetical protein
MGFPHSVPKSINLQGLMRIFGLVIESWDLNWRIVSAVDNPAALSLKTIVKTTEDILCIV